MSKVYVCMHNHVGLGGCGGMLPQEFLGFTCSEIASEAILGQKQSRSIAT